MQAHAHDAVVCSPTRGRAVPRLRPEWVHQLAADFPHLRVTLNGGVSSVADVRRLQSECESRCEQFAHASARGGGHLVATSGRSDGTASAGGAVMADGVRGDGVIDGVMAGRWPLRNPLALCDLRNLRDCDLGAGRGASRPVADAIADYESYAWRTLDRREASVGELAMPLILLAEAMRDAAEAPCEDDGHWEEDQAQARAFDALWQAAETLAFHTAGRKGGAGRSGEHSSDDRSFRLLSKMLSKASGAKVSKKFVRNRSEDLGMA